MTSRADSEVSTLPVRAIELSLQRLLTLDPRSAARLQRLENRSLGLHISGVGISLVLSVHNATIQLQTGDIEQCDATISGGPLSLLRMSRNDGVQSLFRGDVALHGDATVAKSFKRLFDTLDIDWEEQLSQLLGDYPAFRLMHAVRNFQAWFDRSRAVLREDTADYLKEERRLLGNHHEVGEFYDGVDQLRDDVARLNARLEQLRNNRTAS